MARLELQAGPERRPEALRNLQEARDLLPNEPDAIWALADLYLDAGERSEAENLLTRLEKEGAGLAPIQYLRARARMQEEDFATAVLLLERSRTDLTRMPQLALQADFLLGLCYARLNNPERQLDALNRAFGANASSVPIAENRALAFLNLGRLDDAIREYQRLLPQAPELHLTVARLLLARNLSRPPARRNWSDLEALLRDAPETLRQTVDFPLLNIDFLLAQGKDAEAEEKAKAARDAHPREVRCWLVLAVLAERKEKEDPEKARAALRVLDVAGKEVGDCAELRLARVTRQLYGKKREEGTDVLRAMERRGGRLASGQSAPPGKRGLAELQARIGKIAKDAIRLWRQVAEGSRTTSTSGRYCSIWPWVRDDKAEIDRVLAEVHTIEGPEGSLWRFDEAVLQIEASRKGGDREGLLTARARPWPKLRKDPSGTGDACPDGALACIDEVEGNIDGAIEKYREGDPAAASANRFCVRHTVELLMGRRQFKEAREILPCDAGTERRCGRSCSSERRSIVDGKKQPGTRAGTGETGCSAGFGERHRDHLWLGQVYWVNDRKPEAEKAFRKALELNDTVPETWIALVGFLAGTEHKPEAEAELRNAQGKLKPEVVPLVLAPCYEVLGKRKEAEEQHLVLLKGTPNDLTRLARRRSSTCVVVRQKRPNRFCSVPGRSCRCAGHSRKRPRGAGAPWRWCWLAAAITAGAGRP